MTGCDASVMNVMQQCQWWCHAPWSSWQPGDDRRWRSDQTQSRPVAGNIPRLPNTASSRGDIAAEGSTGVSGAALSSPHSPDDIPQVYWLGPQGRPRGQDGEAEEGLGWGRGRPQLHVHPQGQQPDQVRRVRVSRAALLSSVRGCVTLKHNQLPAPDCKT